MSELYMTYELYLNKPFEEKKKTWPLEPDRLA